ncbi:YitT family protein [uncultured Acetatifactor sp.]|mgnify:FL=1|uniref:YitT family protein n=1 Tax=uncultured Acetatifactor sp. TaxID=1671927 RepID=UPI0026153385|nr:YitT family protein [uncultured Acetatifactor sp.]
MKENKGQVSKEQEKEIRDEEKKTLRRRLTDYLVITVASVIYAVAVSFFLDPNSLAPGGVTGIAIIFNRITGLETGTWMFMINIPILALGMWKFGWKFILSTLYCTAATSFFTNRLASVGAVTADPLLAAVVGGSLMAVSLGLVFKAGATTGGTDIIVKLLRLRFPHLKTGSLFLLTDAIIVTASAFVFQDLDTALYAGLVVFINSVLLDIVLYGRDGAKMFFIISDSPERIVSRLLEELDISATYISGSGAYTGTDKKVVLCVVKKPLSPKLEEIVRQEDPSAFTIITSASEIYGEGYKSIFSQKL